MNFWDILILLTVIAAVTLAVFQIRRNRKAGKGSCSCGCGSCRGCDLSTKTKEK